MAPALFLTWSVHLRSLHFLTYKMGLITMPGHLLVVVGITWPQTCEGLECGAAYSRVLPKQRPGSLKCYQGPFDDLLLGLPSRPGLG